MKNTKKWRRLRHPLEYAATRFAFWLVDALPPAALIPIARGVGMLIFHLLGARRRIACANLLTTGVAATPQEARRIALASIMNFSLLAVEALKAETLITAKNWRDYVTVDDRAGLLPGLRENPEGLIVVTAHFGNWEIGGQVLSYFKTVAGIARKMNNPMTDRLINQRKQNQNFRLVPKTSKGSTQLITTLREGAIVAMLADQHAHKNYTIRSFLGRPACMHTSPARLHLLTGAPLCVVLCRRLAPFRFHLTLHPLIRHAPSSDRSKDVADILDRVHPLLEAGIRAFPEQYLWGHRHWRVPPANATSASPA